MSIDGEKLLRHLRKDYVTDGHTLGEDMDAWTDDEVLSFQGILEHWHYQVGRQLIRRVLRPQE